MKVTGMLVGKLKLNPKGDQCGCGSSVNRPLKEAIRLGLGLGLGLRCVVVPAMPCSFLNVRFCAFSGKEFLFKFLMHSPKRYLNKQIIIVTFRPKHPK